MESILGFIQIVVCSTDSSELFSNNFNNMYKVEGGLEIGLIDLLFQEGLNNCMFQICL